jgi:CRISPR/Cas system-associated exonuclease Cas4 (RecB family)
MSKLKEIELYLKRKPLAEAIGTNTTYLSALSDKQITLEMEQRLRDAVEKIIKELRLIIKKKR